MGGAGSDENIGDRVESAYRSLDRVISWINNADTKALIFLTFDGLLAGVLIASSETVGQALARSRPVTWQNVIIGLGIGFGISFVLSILLLLSALFPRVSEDAGEQGKLIFFGSIAGYPNRTAFMQAARTLKPKTIEDGLLEQVYVNSQIAARKFSRLRISVVLVAISVLLLVATATCLVLSSGQVKLPFQTLNAT